jgi:hypothetical protein
MFEVNLNQFVSTADPNPLFMCFVTTIRARDLMIGETNFVVSTVISGRPAVQSIASDISSAAS